MTVKRVGAFRPDLRRGPLETVMAVPGTPEPGIFFVAVLAAGKTELAVALDALTREFGPAAACAMPLPFAYTNYYRDELGDSPLRSFLAFPGIFPQEKLSRRKLATNRMEKDVAAVLGGGLPRPVNLDPGYLTRSKLILASAKDFSHRIYLGDGIFAEVTLQYRKGRFHSLPWTFPDYGSGDYDPFFLALREMLRGSLEV